MKLRAIKHLSFVLLVVALSGCASGINKHNAKRYSDAGYAALQRGDWEGARVAFYRASVNADLGNAPERGQSVVIYEYGRASGVRCKFADAETALKRSLEIDEKSGGPTHYPLFELARLHYDQGQFAQSVPYYERGLAKVKTFEAETLSQDPIGYAEMLEEYSTALRKAGRESEAQAPSERASELRTRNKDAASRTDRTPYGKHCDPA